MNSKKPSTEKLEDLDAFIIRWNNKFPFDYWWRKKYGVPFNSDEHRSTCLIDMYYDYREEELLKRNLEKVNDRKERKKKYKETGSFLRERDPYDDDIPQEEIEQDFENLEV